MEMNKGEAEKCKALGIKFLKSENYAKSIRFFEKSLKLYPLSGVKELIARAERGSELGSSRTSHKSTATHAHSENRTDTRSYTPNQINIVSKIIACKHKYYEVLGVPKNADGKSIKKAYRKLALLSHPDKNSAPGAEEAFKAVGKAFSVLSCEQKRAHYDRYGEDDSSSSNGRGRHEESSTYNSAEEMSAEDLFHAFFGHARRRPRSARNPHQHPRQRQEHGNGQIAGIGNIAQLLPILVLILFAFMSPSEYRHRAPPFSLKRNSMFPIERFTQTPYVPRGIQYYVDRDFSMKYVRDNRRLSDIELSVAGQWRNMYSDACKSEKRNRNRRIANAQRINNIAKRDEALRQAQAPLKSCERLKAKFPNSY